MLKNAYLLAKFGADTAENERHFAEILPIGRRVVDRCRWAARGSSPGAQPALSPRPAPVRAAAADSAAPDSAQTTARLQKESNIVISQQI